MGKMEIGILVTIGSATVLLYVLEIVRFMARCRRLDEQRRLTRPSCPGGNDVRIGVAGEQIFAGDMCSLGPDHKIYRIPSPNDCGPVVGPFCFVDIIAKERTNEMLNVILLSVGLPVSPAADVVKQKLIVERSPAGPFPAREVLELDKGKDWLETPIYEVTVKALQDSTVRLLYTVRDDAGNWSNTVERSLVARDTLPPELLGEILASNTGEEALDEAAGEQPGILVDLENASDAEKVELTGSDAAAPQAPAEAAAEAGEEETGDPANPEPDLASKGM